MLGLRTPAALLTLCALLLTSCEPARVTAPRSAAPAPAGAEARSSEAGSYTLVEGTLPLGVDLRVSEVIGLEGGTLRLAGHTLAVPAGAVSAPTLFSMAQLPGGLVEVEMLALRSTLAGTLLDVGEQGFAVPVTLTLTYAWADDVPDPARLLIVWRKPDGTLEPLPSRVDPETRTVTAELEHFSRYCLATN